MTRRVLIQHPDGRVYDIPLDLYRADGMVRVGDVLVSYESAGFAIDRYADGEPYFLPTPPSDEMTEGSVALVPAGKKGKE